LGRVSSGWHLGQRLLASWWAKETAMQINDVVSAMLVGLVIGVLGRLILPGRQHIGAFMTFVIGIGSAPLSSTFIMPSRPAPSNRPQ
jgi:flagellar biosynthesis protein FliR